MGVYKKGKNYFIDYYVNGRRKREMIGRNRKLAIHVLAKRKVEIIENRFLDKKIESKVPLKDFALLFLNTNYAAKKSREREERALNIFIRLWGNKLLSEITPLIIEQYRAKRIEKVKPATINREISPLKTMFNKAVEWGKLDKNPAENIKPFRLNNQRKRYITQAEFERLYDECSPGIKPIVLLARHTGMRRGEILNLRWSDIDLSNRIINIADSKTGQREIFMNKTVYKMFLKLAKAISPKKKIFKLTSLSKAISRNKKVFTIKNIAKSFERACKRAKIANFRPHDLRHTFASHLVMSGVDLNTVRSLLGHKDIKMTLRYSHLSPSHKRKAIEVLDTYADQEMDTNMDTNPKSQEKQIIVSD